MRHDTPTRPATASELAPVALALPKLDRLPQILEYSDAEIAERASAFGLIAPLDWWVEGTSLVAEITVNGREFRVECETVATKDVVEHASTWIYDGNRCLPAEGEHARLYLLVRAAAESEVFDRAPSLLSAHTAERDEQRAENARDFAESIGVSP
jgi:hypothetical protein